MRLGVVEGVCWAIMIGFGETYFLANALRLGASTLEQALVVTLPLALGAIGPLISLRLLYRAPRRRPVVVSLTALQSAVLLAMAGSDAAGIAHAGAPDRALLPLPDVQPGLEHGVELVVRRPGAARAARPLLRAAQPRRSHLDRGRGAGGRAVAAAARAQRADPGR